MKKIKSKINQKDRVVCTPCMGNYKFFYYSVESKEYIFLFAIDKTSSSSVYDYFCTKGRNLCSRGVSLTIKELYEFKHFRNVKLTNVINRVPIMIDYVLCNQLMSEKNNTYSTETGIKKIESAA